MATVWSIFGWAGLIVTLSTRLICGMGRWGQELKDPVAKSFVAGAFARPYQLRVVVLALLATRVAWSETEADKRRQTTTHS